MENEFNDRQHLPGVLSMARQADPIERQGAMPRTEYANSAGSQFFICLNYDACKALDKRYTAFGKVIEGMSVVEEVAKVPVGGDSHDVPATPQVIKSIRVYSVEAGKNPYRDIVTIWRPPATQPTTR